MKLPKDTKKRRIPGLPKPVVLSPRELRKRELSELHGIDYRDIFIDPVNGVELYRNHQGAWVHDPAYREV